MACQFATSGPGFFMLHEVVLPGYRLGLLKGAESVVWDS